MDEVAKARGLAAQAADRPVTSAGRRASKDADVASQSAADAERVGQPPRAVKGPLPTAAPEGPQPSPDPAKP